MEEGDIIGLLGKSVRFAGVPMNLALVSDDSLYGLGKFFDGYGATNADIDHVRYILLTHEIDDGIGKVIGVEKLSLGASGSQQVTGVFPASFAS